MKKIFITLAASILFCSVSAFAQITPEEIYSSLDRMEQLQKIGNPSDAGMKNIDALGRKAAESRNSSLEITNTLHKYYYLSGGELPEGLVYVGNPPTIAELENVYNQIEAQAKRITESAELIVQAGGDLKGAKPMAIGKAKKSIDTSKDIFTVVGQETEYQTRLAKQVMDNISGQ